MGVHTKRWCMDTAAKTCWTGCRWEPCTSGLLVALSADGNTAIVGGDGDNNFAGAAWVYTRSGGVWTQQQKLFGIGAVGSAYQGESVALSAHGDTAIVGGYGDNSFAGSRVGVYTERWRMDTAAKTCWLRAGGERT